mmetsp:Transcript_56187/g.121033  ORF Transcript_56187/g.121033 Transcript_56187/m.121033 type:complete len:599 (+) Transcript_56187:74-1870(+)
MSGNILKSLGAPIQGGLSREVAVKSLSTYSKEALIAALTQIGNAGPGTAEELKIGDRLIRLLGHPDPEVAATAAWACGASCLHRATEFLLQGLGHPVVTARASCIEAVGKMGPPIDLAHSKAIAASATNDSESACKMAAAKALGEMEATECFEAVSALLQDPMPEVKAAAMETIGIFVGMSQEVESMFPPETVSSLVTSMCADSRTKQAALSAVCSMAGKVPESCAGVVASCLGDQDLSIRMAAVLAMGAMPEAVMTSKDALSSVKSSLKASSSGVRAAAAQALAAIGKPAADLAGEVVPLLGDSEEDTSGLALQIGSGCKRAIPQMRRPKCAALSALGRMGDTAYISKISEALNDQIWEVRLCATEALSMFGEEAKGEVSTISSLLEDDAFPVRAMACNALGVIGHTDALPRLVEAFEDSSHTVRLAAVTAVGEYGEKAEEHSHEVFKLVNDQVGHVRGQAARTLGQLGSTGANYASVIATMLYDEDPEVRAAVCDALACMGEAGAALADEVSDRVQDPVAAVRDSAYAALECFGYGVAPMLKDQPMTKHWKVEGIPGGQAEGGRAEKFEGLGLFYSDIHAKKNALMSSGKWIEGIL